MTARHADVPDAGTPSDAEIISAVRAGDNDAYGLLFERHQAAAHRLARQLVRSTDSDDLVAESFARVLAVLQNGKGPNESFRAYLLTAMRRLHIDRSKAAQRVRPTDDEAELDRHVEWVDPSQMRFEHGAAAAAFAALPERWQLVLWHLDVEGQKPAEIAPLLGMSANSVSALAYRAREGLRQAYLQGHLAADQRDGCRDVVSLLGAHVRGGLSNRDTAKVTTHLDECARCTGLLLELREVNQNLSGLIAPVLLGAAAAGYLGAGHGIGATLTGMALALKGGAAGLAEAVLAPFKTAGNTLVASGTQGAVAAVAVVAVGAGVVAVGTGMSDDPAAASATPTPSVSEPSIEAPVMDPTPDVPTPTPSGPTPSMPEPTMPSGPPTPTFSTPPPPSAPQPTTTAAPPSVSPPRTTATDYGVASIGVANQAPRLQRELRATISAAAGDGATAQKVSVMFAFTSSQQLRGINTDGWSCDAESGDQVTVVDCSRTVAAGKGTELAISVMGTTPHGSVTVSAAGDPRPGNDRREFTAPVWEAP